MHRSVTSEDVEEYQEENQAHNIHLTKDEDIEYRSGILYSSSGTTFVQVLTLPQGKRQQFADGEEPLSNPNMFTVNGSYTLDKLRCYTLSRSAATPKNKRNANNLVETSLRATIDKHKWTYIDYIHYTCASLPRANAQNLNLNVSGCVTHV